VIFQLKSENNIVPKFALLINIHVTCLVHFLLKIVSHLRSVMNDLWLQFYVRILEFNLVLRYSIVTCTRLYIGRLSLVFSRQLHGKCN